MENKKFNPTDLGTPQGRPLSPLLANIALHGSEKALKVKYHGTGSMGTEYTPVRYVDDFIALCRTQADSENAKVKISEYLKPMNLELSPEKTKITNATDGFDFLGWNFRHYQSFKNIKTN